MSRVLTKVQSLFPPVQNFTAKTRHNTKNSTGVSIGTATSQEPLICQTYSRGDASLISTVSTSARQQSMIIISAYPHNLHLLPATLMLI